MAAPPFKHHSPIPEIVVTSFNEPHHCTNAESDSSEAIAIRELDTKDSSAPADAPDEMDRVLGKFCFDIFAISEFTFGGGSHSAI